MENVGIGTTSPSGRLHVEGNMIISEPIDGDQTPMLTFDIGGTSTTNNWSIGFDRSDDSNIFKISNAWKTF